MHFLKFHVFRNNFLLKHARDLIFSLQVVNMMTKKILKDFQNFENFQNGGHFCPKIGKNYDFWDKNGRHFEIFQKSPIYWSHTSRFFLNIEKLKPCVRFTIL